MSVNGAVCRLRRRSFQVFDYLARHSNRMVTKNELFEHVWGDTVVGDDSLTQCISEIRKAISDRSFSILKTVPRRGYILVPDEIEKANEDQVPKQVPRNHATRGSKKEPQLVSDIFKFIVGPPVCSPELFFGRRAVLSRIFESWRQPPFGHISITGPRRSGKTSLLQHLRPISGGAKIKTRKNQKSNWLESADRYQWIFINFQDPRMRSQSFLLNWILDHTGHQPITDCSLEQFMDQVTGYRWTTPTIILMDELEAGLASEELDQPFWWMLRSLTQMTEGLIGIVLASYQQPMQAAENLGKTSPFFNIFTSYTCLLYTSPSPRDKRQSRMPSSA